MKLEGNEIISIDEYDILYSYYDCWKCTNERLNAVFQGVVEADGQMENAIKHRINAGDKANNAKDQTVASIFDNRFCIPLDFEILETSLPLIKLELNIWKAVFSMIESLEPALYHSTILTQVFLLISIAHQKVSKVYYSSLRKKGAPLNLPVILKNSLTPK